MVERLTRPKESPALPPLVYDVSQAATVLSVSEHVIENLIKTNQVQVIRLGRSRRIPVKSLEDLVTRLAAGNHAAAAVEGSEARTVELQGLQEAKRGLSEALREIDQVLDPAR